MRIKACSCHDEVRDMEVTAFRTNNPFASNWSAGDIMDAMDHLNGLLDSGEGLDHDITDAMDAEGIGKVVVFSSRYKACKYCSDTEDSWGCNYCDEEFYSEKAASYHERFHCKIKRKKRKNARKREVKARKHVKTAWRHINMMERLPKEIQEIVGHFLEKDWIEVTRCSRKNHKILIKDLSRAMEKLDICYEDSYNKMSHGADRDAQAEDYWEIEHPIPMVDMFIYTKNGYFSDNVGNLHGAIDAICSPGTVPEFLDLFFTE